MIGYKNKNIFFYQSQDRFVMAGVVVDPIQPVGVTDGHLRKVRSSGSEI
jgi:hypothetical protein